MNELPVIDKLTDDYPGDFHEHLLEQYKLVRSSVVDIQNDRNTNNRFLLAVSTGLLAIPAYAFKQVIEVKEPELISLLSLIMLIIPALGIGISLLWRRWNLSYAEAMRVRYGVLKEIERELPASPFTREAERRKDYISVSRITVRMSVIFLCINIVFVVLGLLYLQRIGLHFIFAQ